MTELEALRQGWGWTGIEFARIEAVSPMGHLLVADADGCLYHLDPGLFTVAALGNEDAARAHFANDDMRLVRQAHTWVEAARERLGQCPDGSIYFLRPIALTEGNYIRDEFCILPLAELISVTGEITRQTKDLSPGAKFEITIVD